MNLHTSVQQAIEQDLNTLQEQHQKELDALKAEYKSELQELNRQYQGTIQEEINQRANLETYSMKQTITFDRTKELSQAIDSAYVNIVPELLQKKVFTQQLTAFLSEAEKGTTVRVSGEHAKTLESAVTQLGYPATVESGEGLGTIVYTGDSIHAEFSVEDFLEKVKRMSIDSVMKSLKS